MRKSVKKRYKSNDSFDNIKNNDSFIESESD